MALSTPVEEIIRQSSDALLSKHESWERVQLSELAEILNGFAFKSSRFNKERGTPLIRIRDVGKDSTDVLYDGPYEEQYLIEVGDLLIGMDGDFNSARWKGPEALLNQRVCKVDLESEHYSAGFLEHVLPGYLKAINAKTSAVTVKHLSSKSVKEILLPLPPLNEQRRIVEKIEELFTKLDAGVRSLEQARAQLKSYRRSVLKAAVEGELSREWREAHKDELEPASELLERILQERRQQWESEELVKFEAKSRVPRNNNWKQKYKTPRPPETRNLPEVPDGWSWTNFEQLAQAEPNALKAGPFGSALKKSYYVPSGYKIYGQEQVLRGDAHYGDYYIDEERYQNLASCAVAPGDILISLVGSIGQVLVLPEGIEPGIINPRLVKLSLDDQLVGSRYIKILLESPVIKEYFARTSHGGTMDILNLTILKELSIPLPPVEEQRFIVEEVERRLSVVKKLEETVETNLKQADALRQSILKRAFSGELVPQDPEDEPAGVLLERIRAERRGTDRKVKRPRKAQGKDELQGRLI